MRIVEIEHKPDRSIKGATVYLSYENLREINNALYQVSNDEKKQKSRDFNETYRDIFLLFELVKNGCIDGFTVNHLVEIHNRVINKKIEATKKECEGE